MDYFDTLNSPKKAELAYAKWYSQLPDKRKAKMMCDFFEFPFKKLEYDIRKENQFATRASITAKVIEHTQKEDYSEEVFAFIQDKMKERSEKEWQARFKTMKKALVLWERSP